jgi:hypothetical protein
MGMISIGVTGSFKPKQKAFSAMKHGHAAAVAEAIRWLSGEVLPEAIRQDHDLHTKGELPTNNFGKD